MPLNKNVLSYLCCPKCKKGLLLKNDFLICKECRQRYKTEEGIPIMVDLSRLSPYQRRQLRYFEKRGGENSQYQLDEWQKSYLRRFKIFFKGIKHQLVIDCGAGSGYMAIELAKLGVRVIASDLTLKNLINLKRIVARQKLKGEIFFVCCLAEELPFKNEMADSFIINAVLEHIPKEEKAVDEINRVCKVNSGLMISLPLSYKYLDPLLAPLNYLHDKRIGHLRRYSKEILIDKFSNWRLVKTYYTGHFKKVIKTLINDNFVKLFDKKEIEKEDRKEEDKKWGASNIICFLVKQS